MDLIITPEPHFLPGYTGHCPQFCFRQGKTFGKLTHKLLIDPCVNHAPELILNKRQNNAEKESETCLYPIIPGYDGFVPNMPSKIGNRYMAAAKAGMEEHQALMKLFRCERRNLNHLDLLESGCGLFEKKLGERLVRKLPCYGGHIPTAMSRFGQSNKQLTNSALCEFTNNYHHRRSTEWCPQISTGVGTSCTNTGQFVIYHRNIGLVPSYSGHVPGEAFTFGSTYGHATVDAKNYLARNKD